jgi:hypothetical protein
MPSDWDEIDWKDDSGLIAFREWKKRNKIRERTKEDLEKMVDFTPEDWILIMLHLNGDSMKTTSLFKELCIFGERTGLNDSGIFSWYPHHYGAYSDVIEKTLKDLLLSGELELERGKNEEGHVFKNYIIRNTEQTEKLCNLIPESIMNTLLELKDEFKDKRTIEIVNYVHDAYPEYATK